MPPLPYIVHYIINSRGDRGCRVKFNLGGILMGGIIAILLIGGLFWWAVVSGKEQERREKAERARKEREKEFEEANQPFRDIYYNKAKFEEWKQKAQSGDAKAQGVLGAIYLHGAEDKDLAMHWFRKAAENGDETAIKILADEQRRQQQWLDDRRFVEEQMAREQFVRDVNNLRKGRKLYY